MKKSKLFRIRRRFTRSKREILSPFWRMARIKKSVTVTFTERISESTSEVLNAWVNCVSNAVTNIEITDVKTTGDHVGMDISIYDEN